LYAIIYVPLVIWLAKTSLQQSPQVLKKDLWVTRFNHEDRRKSRLVKQKLTECLYTVNTPPAGSAVERLDLLDKYSIELLTPSSPGGSSLEEGYLWGGLPSVFQPWPDVVKGD